MPGRPPVWPTKLEVNMIEPPPDWRMAGICYFAPKNPLVRFVSITPRHSWISIEGMSL
jgi:hypothetical protein